MALRTKRGNVTSTARKRYGAKGGSKKGSFPIFDKKSATSAIKLRGRRSGKARASIISRAAKYAPAAAKRARAADSGRKLTRKK